MRDALSDAEKFAIISRYESFESGNISVLAGMDKIQIIAGHCCHCEFCGGHSHIHLIAPPGIAKGIVILNKVPVLLLLSRWITFIIVSFLIILILAHDRRLGCRSPL
jgi:hypothetical protein